MSSVSRSVGRPVSRSVLSGQLNTLASIIKSLFANSEQGFAYDPNDLTTLYQDAAGTIPVTAAEQPVGLMLDKSNGLSLGAELVSNLWVARANTKVEYINSKVRISPIGSGAWGVDCVLSSNAKAGTYYKIELSLITSVPDRVLYQRFTSGAFQAKARKIAFYELSTGNSTLTFSDVTSIAGEYIDIEVSVKELAGNHAYQTTSAARPVVRNPFILGDELAPALTADNWIKDGGWVFDTDGNASVVSSGVTSADYIQGSRSGLSIGKTYVVEIEYDNFTSGGLHVSLWAGSAVSWAQLKQPAGKTSVVIYATSTPTHIRIGNVSITKIRVKKVSLKEVTGYVTDQHIVNYDGIDDKLVTNLPAQLTGCTVIRSVPNVGTQILTNQTVPTPYNGNIDHCGLIVINRDLTASETSQITKLFNKAAEV